MIHAQIRHNIQGVKIDIFKTNLHISHNVQPTVLAERNSFFVPFIKSFDKTIILSLASP